MREILERECPGLSVSLSHEIAREWREYERASSAVLDAYIAPRVERYLAAPRARARRRGRRGAAARDAVERRHHDGAQRRASSRSRRCSPARSAGRWAAPRWRALDGTPEPALHRHGRHVASTSSLVVDGQPERLEETSSRASRADAARRHPHDRRRRRLARLARGGRPARRAARAPAPIPGPPATAAAGRSRPSPTPTSSSAGSTRRTSSAGGWRSTTRRPQRAARTRSRPSSASATTELAEGMLASSTRRWPTRCARSRSSRASTRATSRSSPSAAPARCTRSAWPRSSRSREVIVPLEPGHVLGLGHAPDRHAPRRRRAFYRPSRSSTRLTSPPSRELAEEGSTLLERRGRGARRVASAHAADMRYVGQEYTLNVR